MYTLPGPDVMWHVYEVVGAWRACYGRPPALGQLVYASGLQPGLVRWALVQLWRRGLVAWNGRRRGQG